MLMTKRRLQVPPLMMRRMNCMKLKASLSTLAGGRCNMCMPIRYENKWAIKKRFTQLQRSAKLFARNSGKINDALNATMNVLTVISCSRSLKI